MYVYICIKVHKKIEEINKHTRLFKILQLTFIQGTNVNF